MKNWILGLVLVLAFVSVGTWYLLNKNTKYSTSNLENTLTVQPTQAPTQTDNKSATEDGKSNTATQIHEITVSSNGFNFTPNQIRVKRGERVKIIYKDGGGNHNLTIEGLNLATKTISGGESDTLQFIANKTGTFSFYCSIPGHREAGMTGKLIVE